MRVAVLALALAFPWQAHAQAPLITGLGGPLDFGTDSPPRADDDSMPTALSLAATFPGGIDLYGTHYNDVFVNINGSLTFGASIGTFSPDPFPRAAGGVPMIAGWWANVDTRTVPPTAMDANQIYYASTSEHFVVTWIDVGYFDRHIDRLNAFQIILRPPSSGVVGAADVELRYHRCEWTTGDDLASGGTGGLGGMPAQAGFDQGDGAHSILLPGSGTSAVLSLCTRMNGTIPGVWSMTIGGPAVCGNGFVEPGEECDDGNTEPHDFCDDACALTSPCYTDVPDGGRHEPFADASADAALDATLPVPPCNPPDASLEDADISPDAASHDGGRRADAGTRFDAGPRFDAAVRRDSGPHAATNAIDVTGAGCGCRTSASGSPSVASLVLLAIVLRRIRARARARAGTSRRP